MYEKPNPFITSFNGNLKIANVLIIIFRKNIL